ncbi:MAG: ABC transporter ATP-binding protein [Alphaproteobacteria bacterium]|nr:ABC transporter ATP-binding protein [Alphaproteobacteria bacterium]
MRKIFEKIPPLTAVPSSPSRFLWDVLDGMRFWAFTGMFLAFCLQLMKVFVPVFFSDMIDYFSKITPTEFSWAKMWWFLAAIFGSFILQSIFRMVRELIEDIRVRNIMEEKIKLFCVDYLAHHSESYFAAQKTGQMSQKVTECANKAREVHGLISRLYSNFFLVSINFFFIGRINLWLLLLVIIFGSVSGYLSYRSSFKVRELNKISSDKFDNFNGVLADSIGNALTVKAFGSEQYEQQYLADVFADAKQTRLQALNKMYNSLRTQQMLLCLFEIGTLLLLIKLWYAHQIGIGDVTLIIMLMNTVMSCFSMILTNICDLNSMLGGLQAAMSPFVAKHEIIDAPNAKKLKVNGGEIEFKNVTFAYDSQKIFDNLSVKIKAGEKIGLVGASGSGKSTFINLLQRAYNLQSGKILIDGQDIGKVKQADLHDSIALIPQDTSLFHRSIMQNISYGNLKAKSLEILQASKKAYAEDFIKKLPQGFQTKVGEKGVKLSGGERQRIAIARAILKNSPILILDEATSALDSEAEKYIQKALKNLMKDKTVIAIAHRLSTLKEMDRIIVLDKGKIVEQGKIKDLLKTDGPFRRLWELQSQN